MTGSVPKEAPARTRLRTVALPGGLTVACQTLTEARFFYEDIFEKRIYHRGGISLEGVQTVFDVGANIGLFSLFVHRWCPGAEIFAFEPVPALNEILRCNAEAHGARLRVLECALAERSGRAPFTFYVNSSGLSSLHADREEERRTLEKIFQNQVHQGREGAEDVLRHSEDLLEERLRTEVIEVPVRTVSEVVREHGIERIDLLKIDVQRAEGQVLAGIVDEDWPKIRQLVVEVHDVENRVGWMTGRLEELGFSVLTEQDDHYQGSDVFNLYAVRRPRPRQDREMSRVRDRGSLLKRALSKHASAEARRGEDHE